LRRDTTTRFTILRRLALDLARLASWAAGPVRWAWLVAGIEARRRLKR
jgi:hypothetical protein